MILQNVTNRISCDLLLCVCDQIRNLSWTKRKITNIYYTVIFEDFGRKVARLDYFIMKKEAVSVKINDAVFVVKNNASSNQSYIKCKNS